MVRRPIGVAFLLCVGSVALFAQERYGIPTYAAEVVKVFPVGTGSGAFGYARPSEDKNSPSTVAFDADGSFYVNDYVNNRTVVLEQDFTWSHTIPTGPIGSRMYVHSFGIETVRLTGVTLWDFSGNLVFELDTSEITYNNRPLAPQVGPSRYVVLDDDYVVAYLTNGAVVSFVNLTRYPAANVRRFLDPTETITLLQQTGPQYNVSVGGPGETRLSVDRENMPETSTSDSTVLYRDGRPMGRDPVIYFGLDGPLVASDQRTGTTPLSQILSNRDSVVSPLSGNAAIPIINFWRISQSMRYGGRDTTGATYWFAGDWVFVFDSGNTFTDVFAYSPRPTSQMSVSPVGDVYYLVSGPEGHTVYRVSRRW